LRAAALAEGMGLADVAGADEETIMDRLSAIAHETLRTSERWSILEDDTKAYLARIMINDVMIVLGLELGVFHGDMLLFASASNAAAPATWQPHVSGRIETHYVDAEREEMLDPEPAAKIGPILAARLR
jgi:thioesterase domain-containing protein